MSQNCAISAKGVFYRYENAAKDAVRGVDITIDEGDFVGILGRNGSGKSTLGKLFNGLFLVSAGEVEVWGRPIRDENDGYEARKLCGMVFQDPDNQMVATIVEEDVAFGCENLGMPSEEIAQRVSGALAVVDMLDYARSAPHMLSGGQKQRVAIAGVVAMRPQMIIFDESTSMLDPSGRQEIFDLAHMLNESGTTIVWITHFMEEAARCKTIYVMDEGQIALKGTPKEIFAQGEKIKALGLDVPDMTELAGMLRGAGLDIPDDILTIEEMEVELCRLA